MNRACKFLICIGLVVLLAPSGYSQQKIRTVEQDKYKTKNTPITVSYELGDEPFLNGNKTAAGSDWLRKLALNVRNGSQKTITFFHIELVIEKRGKMENNQAIVVRFPESPEPILDSAGNPTGEFRRPLLMPGKSVKLKIGENQLQVLEILKIQGVEDIDLVSIDIRYVYFEDGTRWMVGHEVRQDPNDKDNWIPVGVEPRKPSLSERFSRWLGSFALINEGSHSILQIASMIPKSGLFFLARAVHLRRLVLRKGVYGGKV